MHNFHAILSGLRPRHRINNEGGQEEEEHQEPHQENESIHHLTEREYQAMLRDNRIQPLCAHVETRKQP